LCYGEKEKWANCIFNSLQSMNKSGVSLIKNDFCTQKSTSNTA
jgi:hypothetical protein